MRSASLSTHAPISCIDCRGCGQPFVVMSDVVEVLTAPRGYVVELTCNNCAHVVVVETTEDDMVMLDLHADVAQREIERAADLLARHRRLNDIALLSLALEGGHLLPEDF